MIARIIKASVYVIRVGLDNSRYHAQPHAIVVYCLVALSLLLPSWLLKALPNVQTTNTLSA